MKKVYANEDWCLGCHLCEYYCAFAHCDEKDMVKAFKNGKPQPRLHIEEGNSLNFAVSCRHCDEPLCVKGCITGALSINDGIITVDENRCVGCWTCILSCPYGAIVRSKDGKKVAKKCDLCVEAGGEPACVKGCPNKALTFEEAREVK